MGDWIGNGHIAPPQRHKPLTYQDIDVMHPYGNVAHGRKPPSLPSYGCPNLESLLLHPSPLPMADGRFRATLIHSLLPKFFEREEHWSPQ